MHLEYCATYVVLKSEDNCGMETTLYLLNFILILKTKQKSLLSLNMILSATRQTYSGGTIQSSKFSPSHIIILNNSAPV